MQLGLKTVGINPVSFRPDFYILPARFLIFEQIRIQYGNTGYQIRSRDGNGLTIFLIVFAFPVFIRDIPLLPIWDIPFFTVYGNWLRSNSSPSTSSSPAQKKFGHPPIPIDGLTPEPQP